MLIETQSQQAFGLEYAGMIPLEFLRHNECAEVTDVVGEPQWVARLADVGLHVGAQLRMVQPGMPCLCEVGSTRLSLRLDDRSQIYVQPALALTSSH